MLPFIRTFAGHDLDLRGVLLTNLAITMKAYNHVYDKRMRGGERTDDNATDICKV